jgi:GNAT superfamily N-acetyltransferase
MLVMQHEFTVCEAVPGEEAIAAALLRRTSPPEIRRLTIWQSSRIEDYLRPFIEDGGRTSGNHIYLLRKSSQIIGAILIRRTGNQMFPQALVVDSAQRGSGLGNLLLGAALEACSNRYPNLDETVWDVFQGFDRLEAWYERLGGVETDRKGWWVADPGLVRAMNISAAYECRGVADAAAQYDERDFCSFEVRIGESAVEVGCLPGPYFRVLSRTALEDPRFLHTLDCIDSQRGILHIGDTAGLQDGWQLQFVTRRLQFKTGSLIQEFKKRTGVRGASGVTEAACKLDQ